MNFDEVVERYITPRGLPEELFKVIENYGVTIELPNGFTIRNDHGKWFYDSWGPRAMEFRGGYDCDLNEVFDDVAAWYQKEQKIQDYDLKVQEFAALTAQVAKLQAKIEK